jgi:glucose-1-phosphate cytidylyltransferase
MNGKLSAETPVFLLAGGLGTRIKEHTSLVPKPMIEIGGRPILWHIMKSYSHYGFRRFVVCTGYKSEVIKDYFLNYRALSTDFTAELETGAIEFHNVHHDEDWTVTVAYTGASTMTGGRIGRAIKNYLGSAEHFAVTYGDGVTDADLAKEFRFHLDHNRTGTLLGIHPPSRFGELLVKGEKISSFSEKPEMAGSWINGGFFFFRRNFADYLSEDESLILEKEPLTSLAKDGELQIYRHEGFWACMDTQRDRDMLESMWNNGDRPWLHENNKVL